jgi:RNA polymerase-interacting CarD/CdnL/TRCF family regulator
MLVTMTDESFKPGDHAVHAIHGAGTITAVQMRDTPDGPVEYVTLELGDMTILIPTAELAEVGVRTPISREDAEAILELLAGAPKDDPGHTARRRQNQSRMNNGEAEGLAKVVRSLTALRGERDKALAMRDMYDLRQATSQLVGELAIALGINEADAADLVEQALVPQQEAGEEPVADDAEG